MYKFYSSSHLLDHLCHLYRTGIQLENAKYYTILYSWKYYWIHSNYQWNFNYSSVLPHLYSIVCLCCSSFHLTSGINSNYPRTFYSLWPDDFCLGNSCILDLLCFICCYTIFYGQKVGCCCCYLVFCVKFFLYFWIIWQAFPHSFFKK